MVDAADPEKIEASKNELHNLLDKPQLQGIPVRTTLTTEAKSARLAFKHFWSPKHMVKMTILYFVPFFELQVLVLGNKRDLPGALDEKELIERM